MIQLVLRPAEHEDAGFAYAVEENAMRAYAEETWGKWNPASDFEGYISSFESATHSVIEVGGESVGIVSVEYHPGFVFLGKLYILDGYRNVGIGAQVLAAVRSEAERRRQPLKFQVLAVNRRAVAFYQKHGFVIESRTKERVYMCTPAA